MFVRDLNVPKMYMCENILQPKAENLEDISGGNRHLAHGTIG